MVIIITTIVILIILNGVIALSSKKVTSRSSVGSNLKSISIIIALRNEEEKIETLLPSLNDFDYTKEQLNIPADLDFDTYQRLLNNYTVSIEEMREVINKRIQDV